MKHAVLCLLLGLGCLPAGLQAAEPLTLFVGSAEGGAISGRRLHNFSRYLNQQGCPVSDIKTAATLPPDLSAQLVFAPLEHEFGAGYQRILNLQVLNGAELSASVLVRGSTAVPDLKALSGVRIAFLSPESVTGYQLARDLFASVGVEHNADRITYTRTSVGAMSLLLHKDVFAAVIATPLADKWRRDNDLQLVGVTDAVNPGALWSKGMSPALQASCQAAFLGLSDGSRSSKKLLKIFPGWLQGFAEPQ